MENKEALVKLAQKMIISKSLNISKGFRAYYLASAGYPNNMAMSGTFSGVEINEITLQFKTISETFKRDDDLFEDCKVIFCDIKQKLTVLYLATHLNFTYLCFNKTTKL